VAQARPHRSGELMARRIDRHEEQTLPASFTALGIEPLPAELLPLRDLARAAFDARRWPRQKVVRGARYRQGLERPSPAHPRRLRRSRCRRSRPARSPGRDRKRLRHSVGSAARISPSEATHREESPPRLSGRHRATRRGETTWSTLRAVKTTRMGSWPAIACRPSLEKE